jgi:hypothetical protein
MAKAGEVQKGQYGRYFHNTVTPVTPSLRKKNASKNSKVDGSRDGVTGVTGHDN